MGKSIAGTQNDQIDLNAGELRNVLRLMRKQMKHMDDLVKNGKIRFLDDADKIKDVRTETKEMYNTLSCKLPKLYEDQN